MQIPQRLKRLAEQIEQRAPRERALLLMVMLAALVTGWQELLMEPLQQAQARQLTRQGELRSELARIETQLVELATTGSLDPDADERRQVTELQAREARLDERIGTLVHGLVAPREMARVLEEVLTRETELVLLRMESLPAVPLPAMESAETSGSGVFRHGLRLELEGSYLATLRYLRALEALQRGFHWDGLELAMDNYPKARVTITVYTLSLSEGWIGV